MSDHTTRHDVAYAAENCFKSVVLPHKKIIASEHLKFSRGKAMNNQTASECLNGACVALREEMGFWCNYRKKAY